MPEYGVFSGPYFSEFGLNTERSLRIQSHAGKYGPEKTLYLDTFHAVTVLRLIYIVLILCVILYIKYVEYG